MDNDKINMSDEEKLLKVIFSEEERVDEAERKACDWLTKHKRMVDVDGIISAVKVAQMTLADDFEMWDEMQDEEKGDLSELMCGLMIAGDLLAGMFGRKMKGRIEKTVE